MKVNIKTQTPPPPPWWVGQQTACLCGAEIELEVGDAAVVSESGERHPNGKRWVTFPCPNCHHSLRIEKPGGIRGVGTKLQ